MPKKRLLAATVAAAMYLATIAVPSQAQERGGGGRGAR